MKKLVAFLVSVSMLVITISTVNAGIFTPSFVSINQAVASLSISGSTATCEGMGIAENRSNAVSITVTLQKKSGTGWSDIASWSASGTGSATISKTYTVSSGSYRVKTYCSINGETTTVYSNIKTR